MKIDRGDRGDRGNGNSNNNSNKIVSVIETFVSDDDNNSNQRHITSNMNDVNVATLYDIDRINDDKDRLLHVCMKFVCCFIWIWL